jgi:hypothetical protein
MGLLKLFGRSGPTSLRRLPSGSFTLDQTGRVVASTLPQSFPAAQAQEIGALVVSAFAKAETANLPLTEMAVHFAALKLTARPLRGGAIVFLSPRDLAPPRRN